MTGPVFYGAEGLLTVVMEISLRDVEGNYLESSRRRADKAARAIASVNYLIIHYVLNTRLDNKVTDFSYFTARLEHKIYS